MTQIATGATVTFGTSAFTANITDFAWSGVSRPSVNADHLGSTAGTFLPGGVVDPGELTLEIHSEGGDNLPPTDAAAETITLEFADGSSLAASGFITNWDPASGSTDELVTGSITIKFTGAITADDGLP